MKRRLKNFVFALALWGVINWYSAQAMAPVLFDVLVS